MIPPVSFDLICRESSLAGTIAPLYDDFCLPIENLKISSGIRELQESISLNTEIVERALLMSSLDLRIVFPKI